MQNPDMHCWKYLVTVRELIATSNCRLVGRFLPDQLAQPRLLWQKASGRGASTCNCKACSSKWQWFSIFTVYLIAVKNMLSYWTQNSVIFFLLWSSGLKGIRDYHVCAYWCPGASSIVLAGIMKTLKIQSAMHMVFKFYRIITLQRSIGNPKPLMSCYQPMPCHHEFCLGFCLPLQQEKGRL